MRELNRQLLFGDQLFGQIGGAATSLDRHSRRWPMPSSDLRDERRVVGHRTIGQTLAVGVEHAYLHRILVVIQTNKKC
jgi:hypothetical protein